MGCKECRLVREPKPIIYDSRTIPTQIAPSIEKVDDLNLSIDEQLHRIHPRRKHLVADVDDYPDVPNLDNLPVELIYYIFDRLDASTIFASLYNVCRRLNTVIKTYNYYHLNLKSISMKQFYRVCSVIRPEQVISLTLSDGNENVGLVKLFLEKFHFDAFARLRTLNLINIDDNEQMMKICLALTDELQRLSIENYQVNYDETVIDILLAVIAKPSLTSLTLDLGHARRWNPLLVWNTECALREIRLIGPCHLTLFRNILICSPNLEVFEAYDIDFDGEWPRDETDEDEDEDDEQIYPQSIMNISHPDRLKSLSFIYARNEMKKLEWLLPQFTQLIHLKYLNVYEYHLGSSFTVDQGIFDGGRWEKVLEHCDKFEFILTHHLDPEQPWSSRQALSTFQNDFWQKKNWPIALEEYDDSLLIYSIPYAHHTHYYDQPKVVSMPNNRFLLNRSMDNIRKLRINMEAVKNLEKKIIGPVRFPYASHLILDGPWEEAESIQSLDRLVELTKIRKLIRFERAPSSIFQNLLTRLPHLESLILTTLVLDDLDGTHFNYIPCLSSLTIVQLSDDDQHSVNIERLCAMFPHVEHLDIPVDHLDACHDVLERLRENLISVVFRFAFDEDEDEEESDFHHELVRWVRRLPQQHQSRVRDGDLYLWLAGH